MSVNDDLILSPPDVLDDSLDITETIESVTSRPVARGGFSDVYTAVISTTHMKVAIKAIHVVDATDAKTLQRLRREISVWKRLSHPNIHTLCGLYQGLGPVPAMVSPWYENGDINAYLSKHVDADNIDVLKLSLLAQVITGLEYLHKQTIVHADIKGGNILISNDGRPCLTDFGLSALLAGHSVSLSAESSALRGTCRWMAPELFVDSSPRHTYASDIWACGCLFIEVQCGVRPYDKKLNDQAVILALSRHELPERPPTMPQPIWLLVLNCCRVQRGERLPLAVIIERLRRLETLAGRGKQPFGVRITEMIVGEFGPSTAATALIGSIQQCIQMASTDYPTLMDELEDLPDFELAPRLLRLLLPWAMTPEASPQPYPAAMLHFCLDALEGEYFSRSATPPPSAVALVAAIKGIKYPPHQLRPLARLVAVLDPDAATGLMKLFSDPTLGPAIQSHYSVIRSLAWLPDGIHLVSASRDEHLRIFDTQTGRVMKLLPPYDDWLPVLVAPYGVLIIALTNAEIIMWDTESGRMVEEYAYDYPSYPSCGAVSSARGLFSVGTRDGTLLCWDLTTARRVFETSTGHGRVCSIAFSTDGTRLVTGGDDAAIRVWDSHTGLLVLGPLTAPGLDSHIDAVSMFPDRHRIAAGYGDMLRIWDLETGEMCMGPLKPPAVQESTVLVSHDITAIDVSLDSTRVVVGYADGRLCIWSALSGSLLAGPFWGHSDYGWSGSTLAFSPDGKRLASGDKNGTLHIWDAAGDWGRWDI